jgi:DNA-binding NarL/FixJ family response regulator
MTCRIVIADDHALFRDGLRAIVSKEPEFSVVAEARDGREAIEQALAHDPDVISMDLLMPWLSGIEATQQIKRRRPAVRVLIVTEQRSPEHVREALLAGCDGYMLKSARSDEFIEAIHFVRTGRPFIHPGVSAQVVQNCLFHSDDSEFQASGWSDLTDKERSIVRLVAEGHTNRSTAEVLNKSIKTIEKYRSSLMAKLGLKSATELVVKAIEHGWIDKAHVGIAHESDPSLRPTQTSRNPQWRSTTH